MFPFRSNPLKKEIQRARDWLQLGEKVRHYRRDLLSSTQLGELERALEDLRGILRGRDRPAESALREASQQLESVLRNCGGSFFPRRFWSENVEMLLVAAILAIGIRTFFLQPFKIPTNSMYPTYNGLTYTIYTEDVPAPPERLFRMGAFGARFHSVTAPDSGELLIPLVETRRGATMQAHGRGFAVRAEPARGRKWLVIPSTVAEYTLLVGNRPVQVQLPVDFTFDKLLLERFGRDQGNQIQFIQGLGYVFRPGVRFERGDTILAFDVLTGDALFVDRMTYHFREPRIGEPFVFRTEGIERITEDKYYIKRLVAEGGDQLTIEEPVLFRNGEPATNSAIFDKNANREEPYRGYTGRGNLANGQSIRIPQDHYFALGDNSPESYDSRDWGFVPKNEVIGRAVIIYYPFTKRWGPSK